MKYLIIALFSLFCSSSYAQEQSPVGAVVGALVGGVLGSQFGQGSGRIASTIVGTGIGAVVGNSVSNGRSNNLPVYYQEQRRPQVYGHIGQQYPDYQNFTGQYPRNSCSVTRQDVQLQNGTVTSVMGCACYDANMGVMRMVDNQSFCR